MVHFRGIASIFARGTHDFPNLTYKLSQIRPSRSYNGSKGITLHATLYNIDQLEKRVFVQRVGVLIWPKWSHISGVARIFPEIRTICEI